MKKSTKKMLLRLVGGFLIMFGTIIGYGSDNTAFFLLGTLITAFGLISLIDN